MKLYKFAMIFIPVAILLCAGSASAESKTRYKLYFLGGQSNMSGFGEAADLAPELSKAQPRVYIFHANDAEDVSKDLRVGTGIWAQLRPGHGINFFFDGASNRYSNTFGPELTFGRQLIKRDPKARIAIIKFSRGATAIQPGAGPGGSWHPQAGWKNQFDYFLKALRRATAIRDIDGDGVEDELVPAGIIWVQGEADAAHTASTAEAYPEHLRSLMSHFRAALRDDDLPIVIAQIADSYGNDGKPMMAYLNEVRAAQKEFTDADPNAKLVTNADRYKFREDLWHFNSDGYVDLGRALADAVIELERD